MNRAVKLGQPALALTDHGNICGAPEFYKAAKAAEVEPVLGCEFYYVEDAAWRPAKGLKEKPVRHHVVMLGVGEPGYQVLVELNTEAHKHFYHKPLLDKKIIEAASKDLKHVVLLSGCAAGPICRPIQEGDFRKAKAELLWFREMFPNFYLELQEHGNKFDRLLNKHLLKFAGKYGLEWVITNDPHYVTKKDAPYHDTLLAIQTASNIDSPDRFRFDGDGYHLRSHAEMVAAFRRYPSGVVRKGIRNSVAIARKCQTRIPEWDKKSWHIPKLPGVDEPFRELRRLALRGMEARGLNGKKKYEKRLKYELQVIKKAKIADFLLITRDCIRWAESQGIPVGPGRGSICGSLVGYLVGLHKVDPVRYNLLFERFLNPARPSLPDIDTDFSQARRDELFNYVTKKYGEKNVMRVTAYHHMKTKKAFLSLAKSHGISYQEAVQVSKTLVDELGPEEQLPEDIQQNYPDLMAQLKRLNGVKSQLSKHAAGVVIAPPDYNLYERVPQLRIAEKGGLVSQYDLDIFESLGLLKQDFLGLRTLDTVDECLKLTRLTWKDVYDWIPDEWDKDVEVYQMLDRGSTAGVFQMEGRTNSRGIQEIGCTCFEDIVSCTALYRTGPILAGFPSKFVKNRKLGSKRIKYVDERLRPILGTTWGVILYQEQVMQIADELAGFDMAMVDDIKDMVKKKDPKRIARLKPLFVQGCLDNGMKEEAVDELWGQIEGYVGYAFNRLHAVGYSLLSYITARLKFAYPLEFFTALLRTVEDKHKRQTYLSEMSDQDIKVLVPHINKSQERATPVRKKNAIRFGFKDLAGIGDKQAAKLVQGRPEKGWRTAESVAEAVNNTKVTAALADSGALRSLGVKGDTHKAEELLDCVFTDNMKELRKKYAERVKLPSGRNGDVLIIGEIMKVEKATTKSGRPYCTWTTCWSPYERFKIRLWDGTQAAWKLKPGTIVAVEGRYEAKWENVSVQNLSQIKRLKPSVSS